jgi:hypothetical protein
MDYPRSLCSSLVLVLVIGIAGASAAQQATLHHTPVPGGRVITPSITADEGQFISYTIEGVDKDTDQVGTTFTLKGDPYVRVYQAYANNRPPSSTRPLESWTQVQYDAATGTRQMSATVKLRAAPELPEGVVIDRYETGDSRRDGSAPYIAPIEYWDGVGDTPIRTPLGQTIIIKAKRGAIQGKVTDAATGFPIQADLWLQDGDPDVPEDFPEVFVSSDPLTGNYTISPVYASWIELACGRYYPTADAIATVWVPRDGVGTQDFILEPAGILD